MADTISDRHWFGNLSHIMRGNHSRDQPTYKHGPLVYCLCANYVPHVLVMCWLCAGYVPRVLAVLGGHPFRVWALD